MNGRFRSDWMRCASRAGRIERVKFAEVSSCFVVRGGLPCLRTRPWSVEEVKGSDFPREHLLDKVGEGQWVERQARKVRDVMIGDCPCVQPL